MKSIEEKRRMTVFAILSVLALVLLVLPTGIAFGEPAETVLGEVPIVGMDAPNAIPDRYIVVFKDEVPAPEIESLADEVVKVHRGKVHFTYKKALRGFAATIPAKSLSALQRNPRVAYIEADRVVSLHEPLIEDSVPDEMQELGVHAEAIQATPTWGLDRIDRRDLPMDWQYTYNLNGAGVRAYVIDTGIRKTHMEFIGRVDPGYSTIYDGRWTDDCNGHGTHVAGTIGGSTYGVAKNVRLVPVRVLDCYGGGELSGIIAGVDWVTANHIHPAVANMSLGGFYSPSLDDAVTNSINHGITYVVAAGNDASPVLSCNQSPSDVYYAITVGATDQNDWRASFSNYGRCVDIYAPGYQITSAWIGSDTDKYVISGTSMAAPHVTGVVALYLQKYPTVGSLAGAYVVADSTYGHVTLLDSNSWNYLLYSRVDLPFIGMTPDRMDGISIINSLPGTISLDTTEYTTSWNDPTLCAGSPSTGGHTAWFYYLPSANGALDLDTFGSNYNTILAVYNIDSSTGKLISIACNDNAGGGYQSQLTNVPMTGAKPLIIEVASYYGTSGGGNLVLHVSAVGPPAAPSDLKASAVSSSEINLSWRDNSTNETGFKIERKIGVGGTYSLIVTVGTNVTTYSNKGLTIKTTYYYRVRAYNTSGDSSYSNEVSATTLTAPTNLTATAVSSSQINLNWRDNSTNETGFKIERQIGVGGTYSLIATVGTNVTTYSDVGLTVNTTYYYRVRAFNASGNSSYSNDASATTGGGGIPADPSNLTASLGYCSINFRTYKAITLTWTDNSNNETGFKIERKEGTTYWQIATVGANVTYYAAECGQVKSGLTYCYHVRAYNASGDSAYNNEACVSVP